MGLLPVCRALHVLRLTVSPRG
uniref:Uncharacterized protein n=1 Tax=Arundo donax TaxID=35708 RepID=A0A0A9GX16_ARUDO